MKTEKDILNEAHKIISGERLNDYGKPEDSFQVIADFWIVYLKHKFQINIQLSTIDVTHMMSLFKHARMLGQKPCRDNYIDAIGYLAICADRLMSKETCNGSN